MSMETEKSEIISWINRLKDSAVIKELMSVKKRFDEKRQTGRVFGSGKYIFTSVSESFNDPLDDFTEYMTK